MFAKGLGGYDWSLSTVHAHMHTDAHMFALPSFVWSSRDRQLCLCLSMSLSLSLSPSRHRSLSLLHRAQSFFVHIYACLMLRTGVKAGISSEVCSVFWCIECLFEMVCKCKTVWTDEWGTVMRFSFFTLTHPVKSQLPHNSNVSLWQVHVCDFSTLASLCVCF